MKYSWNEKWKPGSYRRINSLKEISPRVWGFREAMSFHVLYSNLCVMWEQERAEQMEEKRERQVDKTREVESRQINEMSDRKGKRQIIINSHSGHSAEEEQWFSRWCSAQFSIALWGLVSAQSSHKSWQITSNCKAVKEGHLSGQHLKHVFQTEPTWLMVLSDEVFINNMIK